PGHLVGEQKGAVAFIATNLVVAVPIEAAVAQVREVIEGAVVMTVLMIEAAPRRQILGSEVAEVPFAADRRLVAGLPERLRQRALLHRQAVLGPGTDHAALQTLPQGVAA